MPFLLAHYYTMQSSNPVLFTVGFYDCTIAAGSIHSAVSPSYQSSLFGLKFLGPTLNLVKHSFTTVVLCLGLLVPFGVSRCRFQSHYLTLSRFIAFPKFPKTERAYIGKIFRSRIVANVRKGYEMV